MKNMFKYYYYFFVVAAIYVLVFSLYAKNYINRKNQVVNPSDDGPARRVNSHNPFGGLRPREPVLCRVETEQQTTSAEGTCTVKTITNTITVFYREEDLEDGKLTDIKAYNFTITQT